MHYRPNVFLLMFQSQLNPIASLLSVLFPLVLLGFNPNLIQLREWEELEDKVWGAGFNPNLIQLRVGRTARDQQGGRSFNPNLIQLRADADATSIDFTTKFQSQLNPIARLI